MPDNQKLINILTFIGKPILVGLFVAATLMLLFPEFRGHSIDAKNNHTTQGNSLSANWGGAASYAQAVSLAAPSVVNIYTRKITPANTNPLLNHPLFRRLYKNSRQKQRIQSSLGSGVIMQADGFIITNHHVVDDVNEILVLLYDGREVPASIVGTDAETDLAILKIDAAPLQAINVGEPAQAKIGDVVLAIGNPYGVGQTVTQGIISATGRRGLGLNNLENFIQTDADINPGNSGGALIDAYGNLLGINTAVINRNGSGISFAIPADTVEKVLKDIIQYGYVVRGWLGMMALPLEPHLAKQLKLSTSNGLLVHTVYSGGPMDGAKVRPGDIVTSINGIPVTDRSSSMNQITGVMPGKPIELQILRNTQRFNVTVVAGTRPIAP